RTSPSGDACRSFGHQTARAQAGFLSRRACPRCSCRGSRAAQKYQISAARADRNYLSIRTLEDNSRWHLLAQPLTPASNNLERFSLLVGVFDEFFAVCPPKCLRTSCVVVRPWL